MIEVSDLIHSLLQEKLLGKKVKTHNFEGTVAEISISDDGDGYHEFWRIWIKFAENKSFFPYDLEEEIEILN